MRTVTVIALFAVFWCAGAVRAGASQDDLRIFRGISNRVSGYSQFTIFDSVGASVTRGHVVLGGWVTMPFKRDEIEQRVRAVPGVRSIENGIQVLPVSSFDDELRFRIARAIYGNSAFWGYAAMAQPPIHIVVNGGRVTLEGVVRNNVERQLARSLATGLGEFEVRNELKTDDEVQSELEKIGRELVGVSLAAAGRPQPSTLIF